MIEMLHEEHQSVPVLVCDICHQVLDDASAAAVFNSAIRPGECTAILHVHKGETDGKTCHAQAVALIKAEGETPGWQEMTDHLLRLLANSGITPDQVMEDALREGEEKGWGFTLIR